jgi:hypothetical protein
VVSTSKGKLAAGAVAIGVASASSMRTVVCVTSYPVTVTVTVVVALAGVFEKRTLIPLVGLQLAASGTNRNNTTATAISRERRFASSDLAISPPPSTIRPSCA